MELWTPEHIRTLLPSLGIMILIAAVLRLTLGKKSLKIRMIPFQILACIIVLLEIGKQALSVQRGYDLYHLPFHFCSLFLFVLPAMAFYKGKHVQTVSAITSAVCGSLFLLMLIYPNLIYSAGNINAFFTDFFSFHTVAFHNIVMLAFLLIVALDLHVPAPKGECKAATFFTIGFCAISATMAQVLQTNYANFYRCNVAPVEAFRVSMQGILGYVPTQVIYVLILSGLNIGFVLLSYWAYRLLRSMVTAPKTLRNSKKQPISQ